MAASARELILYHYVPHFPSPRPQKCEKRTRFTLTLAQHYSPYAHKVTYYLALRGLPYHQCPQPPTLPRPDLAEQLGVTYRRIPLLAIGNTVYADTKLILDELERRYPLGALGSGGCEGGGAGESKWAAWSDSVFRFAVACLPTSLALMKDARFQKDREDFSGYVCCPSHPPRPSPLLTLLMCRWVGKVLQPGIHRPQPPQGPAGAGRARVPVHGARAGRRAQVAAGRRRRDTGGPQRLVPPPPPDDGRVTWRKQAVWALEWTINLPGALAGSGISADTYPYTFAWVARFLARMGKVRRAPLVTGADAREAILSSPPSPSSSAPGDAAAQGEGGGGGEWVKVFPVDTGRNHPQRGRLVRCGDGRTELLVTPPGEPQRSLRVVFPTLGYRVEGDGADDAKL